MMLTIVPSTFLSQSWRMMSLTLQPALRLLQTQMDLSLQSQSWPTK